MEEWLPLSTVIEAWLAGSPDWSYDDGWIYSDGTRYAISEAVDLELAGSAPAGPDLDDVKSSVA